MEGRRFEVFGFGVLSFLQGLLCTAYFTFFLRGFGASGFLSLEFVFKGWDRRLG